MVKHAGFFVLRSPARPVEDLFCLGTLGDDWDRAEPNVALQELEAAFADGVSSLTERCKDALFRDAIFVATPSLFNAMCSWLDSGVPLPEGRVLAALTRYYIRMCTRSIPFGLFAGCSVGSITRGGAVELRDGGQQSYVRRTMLDGAWLRAAAKVLLERTDVRRRMRYSTNPTAYRLNNHLRLTLTEEGNDQDRAYCVVDVDTSDVVERIAEHGRVPTAYDDFVSLVQGLGASTQEAVAVVDEAIAIQLLLPVGFSVISGAQPLDALLSSIGDVEPTTAAQSRRMIAVLREVRDVLRRLDNGRQFGNIECYRHGETLLRDHGITAKGDALVHVDLFKSGSAGSLPEVIVHEIGAAVHALYRMMRGKPSASLERFRRAFADRYGTAEVPLLHALDDEIGIGFTSSGEVSTAHAPLIESLMWASRSEMPVPDAAESEVHPHLLRLVTSALALGKNEIELSGDDVDALTRPGDVDLPPTFYAMGTMLARSAESVHEDDWQVFLHGASGPSATAILGRAAGGLPELEECLWRFTALEALDNPSAIAAEIVHIPSGRVANVVSRPLVREYEIPYLAESSASPDNCIALTDLFVSVSDSRVVLRSQRLGKEVLPRIANAHYPAPRVNTPLYRFLRSLECQGVASKISWLWRGLESAPFLPRVRLGRVVLSAARWRLDKNDLAPFREKSFVSRIKAIRRLARERRMPRFVSLVMGDNFLAIDFASPLSIEAASTIVRTMYVADFSECVPSPLHCVMRGPHGSYCHEFVVPVLQQVHSSSSANTTTPHPQPWRGRLAFTPGTDWLYLKVYGNCAATNHILCNAIAPLLAELKAEGVCDRWFFIRYKDPDDHVRIRLHGSARALYSTALLRIRNALDPAVSAGSCDRWVIDTYVPEVERYGGERLLVYSEHLFCSDSQMVTNLLHRYAIAPSEDDKWMWAIASFSALMRDWQYSPSEAAQVARQAAYRLERRAGLGPNIRHRVARYYRQNRTTIEALAASTPAQSVLDAQVAAEIEARSEHNRVIIERLRIAADSQWPDVRAALVPSHLHMHVNRVFLELHEFYEYALYEVIHRAFEATSHRSCNVGLEVAATTI